MKTIHTDGIPDEQIDALDKFSQTAAGPQLRDLLNTLVECIREGAELAPLDSSASELTPNQAAAQLGMSRSHLYKLLDRGEIAFHRVGRDRRIKLRDLVEFDERRERDRRELAERFASQRQTREGAISEIADLL